MKCTTFIALIDEVMMRNSFLFCCVMLMAAIGCSDSNNGEMSPSTGDADKQEDAVVNVYTHRHYPADDKVYELFEKQTGIKVNVVNASADELIKKMELEGDDTPADLLITVDAGRIWRAKDKGLLDVTRSETLNKNVPERYRDDENYWYGMTYRARIFVYSKNNVQPENLSDYAGLTGDQWNDRLLMRSSGNIYNQSLLAAMIAQQGEAAAKSWTEGVVDNLARAPKGNDTDQMYAIAAGAGDLTLANTYYVARLMNSDKADDQEVAEQISVFFPNQQSTGTHVNISAAAITKGSKNKEEALQLLEFITSPQAQKLYTDINNEYPVNPEVTPNKVLVEWGEFKQEDIDLEDLGRYNKKAVMLFDEAGWK